jgi:hypothetical protein
MHHHIKITILNEKINKNTTKNNLDSITYTKNKKKLHQKLVLVVFMSSSSLLHQVKLLHKNYNSIQENPRPGRHRNESGSLYSSGQNWYRLQGMQGKALQKSERHQLQLNVTKHRQAILETESALIHRGYHVQTPPSCAKYSGLLIGINNFNFSRKEPRSLDRAA